MTLLSPKAEPRLPFPILDFDLNRMTLLSSALRSAGFAAQNMEQAAQQMVQVLRGNLLRDNGSGSAVVLARLFKTLPFSRLEPELQEQALKHGPMNDDTRCLVLLGSDGVEPHWQDRRLSRSHRLLPFHSPEAVRRTPMLANLMAEMGLDTRSLSGNGPIRSVHADDTDLGFFFVEDARNHPLIPDQESFVIPYGVRSVLGFGGLFGNGQAYFVALFCNTNVTRELASQLRLLSSSIALGLLPHELGVERSQLWSLLETYERVLEKQVTRLAAEAEVNDILRRINLSINSELDHDKLVQLVTDEATKLCGAEMGAFFYNVQDERGAAYLLYSLAGNVGREFFSQMPMPRATKIFAPTFRGERVMRSENITKHPDFGKNAPFHGMPPGHPVVVSYLAVPVISRDGRVLGGLFFGHKEEAVFSERHERLMEAVAAQAAIALENAELYQQAKRRTEELEKTRDEAGRASRAKTEFIAGVSHEIRTPMNGILGMVRLLLDTSLDSEQQEYAETIRVSAESLLTVIQEILDFSKIESGTIELAERPFSLLQVLGEALAPLAPQAQMKGLTLACIADPRIPDLLRGDSGKLKQILVNLLGNAIKFTNQGEVIVRASLRELHPHEVMLHFSVQDTGIGLSREQQAIIFQPFVQADASVAEQFGGTGLGLAICQRLVGVMHGSIWVESEPGKGSNMQFTVRFQRDESDAPAEDWVSDLACMNVCHLMASGLQREVMNNLLSRWGIVSSAAALDCDQGLDKLKAMESHGQPPGLVFLDMSLQEHQCPGLLQCLNDFQERYDTKIIAIPSFHNPGRFSDLQVAAYLRKPIVLRNLEESIKVAMGTQPPSGAPAPQENGRSVRVLLVEDNPINQRVVTRVLEKQGHFIDVASNGFEALEIWNESEYDLILLDIQMPGMDGYEVAQELRDRERKLKRARTPIVALTARAQVEDRRRCYEAGMDGYLSKPIPPGELITLVRDLALLEGEAFDPGVAEKNLGDASLLREVIDVFLAESPGLLEELRQAYRQGTLTELARAAHRFAGGLTIFGETPCLHAALQVEKLAENGESVDDAMLLFEQSFARLRAVFENRRK